MKIINLLLLIAFLLSSCAPAATMATTSTPTQTLTPAPTATQTPSPTPTIIPTPTPIGGGSGKLIFEYYKVAYEKTFPDLKGEVNIFTSNLDGTDLVPITNGLKAYNYIQSISSDGHMVLVSSRSNYTAKGDLYLFRLDSIGSDPIKLASGLTGGRQAIFLDTTRIIYIGQGREGYGFYTANIDGTNPQKIGAPIGNAWGITALDKARIYWSTIQKENFKDSSGVLYAYGDFQTLWWTNIDGSGQGKLESNGQQIMGDHYAFSPDGKSVAWIPANLEPGCTFQASYWSPWVSGGAYTQHARNGDVIDMAYVEAYARKCFLLHVASLSNMDNPITIPLLPSSDSTTDNFMYQREYYLSWWSDSSKILAYDAGDVLKYYQGRGNNPFAGYHPFAIYEVAPNDATTNLTLLKVLSTGIDDNFNLLGFSPDGRQLLFTKYGQGPYINIFNFETMNFVDDFGRNITPDSQVQRIGNIYWLP